MPETKIVVNSDITGQEPLEINLKDPWLAAFLAWLIPGLGHIYQGRYGKGILFMVCILGTFFYGLYLGEGRVVYASWGPQEHRLHYYCQVGAGLPALPALIQNFRIRRGSSPLSLFGGEFMVPPGENNTEDLSALNARLTHLWDIGTLYTMIAGLLNILVIFDAWGGPVFLEDSPSGKEEEKKKKGVSNSDEKAPRKGNP